MTTPAADPDRPYRTQWMNVLAYHLLITLVNLLNLPLAKGTYVPRRSSRLTVYTRHLDRLKLLKKELDVADPNAVRAYLVPLHALVFELRFLVDQEPNLQANPDFRDGLERLETLLHNTEAVEDFAEVADLAYRLSILLPFYEDAETLESRRAQIAEYERMTARKG